MASRRHVALGEWQVGTRHNSVDTVGNDRYASKRRNIVKYRVLMQELLTNVLLPGTSGAGLFRAT